METEAGILEEEIRRQHRISIKERVDARPFRADCTCSTFVSRWQEFKGAAVQSGRIHVQKMVDKAIKKGEE